MEDKKNIVKWLIEEENYDMSENIEDLATVFLKDHTMLDIINLISDYNKFVLCSIRRSALMKELSKMDGMEREKFANELFSEYCSTCLAKRPCYCMRDD